MYSIDRAIENIGRIRGNRSLSTALAATTLLALSGVYASASPVTAFETGCITDESSNDASRTPDLDRTIKVDTPNWGVKNIRSYGRFAHEKKVELNYGDAARLTIEVDITLTDVLSEPLDPSNPARQRLERLKKFNSYTITPPDTQHGGESVQLELDTKGGCLTSAR